MSYKLPMSEAQTLLKEIEAYCRSRGTAETTFGRLAVNDGKFVGRLRDGGNVTVRTLERVRAFMNSEIDDEFSDDSPDSQNRADERPEPTSPFQFFDNRQRYLAFVNTCDEKSAIAQRIETELDYLQPRPPALHIFDAGMGDATVLSRVMRALHQRFADVPLIVTAKEISFEDVRLALEKLPDRLHEHPSTAIAITNLNYTRLLELSKLGENDQVDWLELALDGDCVHRWATQLSEFEAQLANSWRTQLNADTGNPVSVRPSVLLIYRADRQFSLAPVLPKVGAPLAEQDLIIASQPWRARVSAERKAERILSPLLRLLAPKGRLIAIQSCGDDPGLELVQRIWPSEQPFEVSRHDLIRATRQVLGAAARDFNFKAFSDAKSRFRFAMHSLPSGVGARVGASTLFSAWNAAVYVNQIEETRVDQAIADGRYLAATRETLRRHDGLWFNDESFVITRR